jgi:hypothetical protein
MKVKDVPHVLVIGPWHGIICLRCLELFSDFEQDTGALCRSDELRSPNGRESVWVAFELKDIVLSMTRVPGPITSICVAIRLLVVLRLYLRHEMDISDLRLRAVGEKIVLLFYTSCIRNVPTQRSRGNYEASAVR